MKLNESDRPYNAVKTCTQTLSEIWTSLHALRRRSTSYGLLSSQCELNHQEPSKERFTVPKQCTAHQRISSESEGRFLEPFQSRRFGVQLDLAIGPLGEWIGDRIMGI